jgi:hypothetical protein
MHCCGSHGVITDGSSTTDRYKSWGNDSGAARKVWMWPRYGDCAVSLRSHSTVAVRRAAVEASFWPGRMASGDSGGAASLCISGCNSRGLQSHVLATAALECSCGTVLQILEFPCTMMSMLIRAHLTEARESTRCLPCRMNVARACCATLRVLYNAVFDRQLCCPERE